MSKQQTKCLRCASPRVVPMSLDREHPDALHGRCRDCTATWELMPEQVAELWWAQGRRDAVAELREDQHLRDILKAWNHMPVSSRAVLAKMAAEVIARVSVDTKHAG